MLRRSLVFFLFTFFSLNGIAHPENDPCSPYKQLATAFGPSASIQKDGRIVIQSVQGDHTFTVIPQNTEETARALLALAIAKVAVEKDNSTDHSQLPSYVKYGKHPIPQEMDKILEFVKDPNHWTEERQAVHKKLLADSLQATRKASQVLGTKEKPVLILTRGNSGSGKSYTLAHPQSPALKEMGLEKLASSAELSGGIINPDSFKSQLQALEGGHITSHQVHVEGSMLATQLFDAALAENLSIVIDKRFEKNSDFEPFVKKAKALGYHVVMIDVDAPLYDSASRIAVRKPGGDSPNIPLAPVIEGFKDVRKNRNAVSTSPFIDEYYLFAFDSQNLNNSGFIAERKGNGPVIQHHPEAYAHLTTAPSETEIQQAVEHYGGVLDALSKAEPAALAAASSDPDIKTATDAVEQIQKIGGAFRPPDPAGPHHNPGPEWLQTYMLRKEYLPGNFKIGDVYKIGIYKTEFEVVQIQADKVQLKSRINGMVVGVSYDEFLRMEKEFILTPKSLPDLTNQTFIRGLGVLLRLKDFRYEIQKGDYRLVAHQKLASVAVEYLKSTIPNIKITVKEEKETGRQSASVKIFISNLDANSKKRLLSDTLWKIKPAEAMDDVLLIDTREIGRTDSNKLIEPIEDKGIGYNH